MTRGVVPAYATRFVGRRADLAALGALFAAGARLVTLTGPAGIGKTRVACEYAARRAAGTPAAARPDDDGGARFCELAEARTLDDVCAAVAFALDAGPMGEPDAGAAVERLGAALAQRGPLLLVLDNLEQLTDAIGAALACWLARAPAVAVLATSRERLRLRDECTYELGPLGLPDGAHDAADAEAVQLLVECARRADRSYQLTDAEAASVAAVARELDGVPLALELAAPRVCALGAAAVLARLPRRFELLTGGPRDARARQQSLRDAITASWELLSGPERAALAQCAVFRGGFTLEAAEAVVDLGGQRAAPAVLDVLQSLRDKSLLRAERPPGGGGGAPRFGFYQSIQQYAAEHLAPAGRAGAERRHAVWYARDAARCDDLAHATGGGEYLAALTLERDNLLALVERALARPARDDDDDDARELALRGLLALEPVVRHLGPLGAYLALLDAALGADAPGPPPPPLTDASGSARARALLARAEVRRRRADADAALRDCAAALALARAVRDRRLEGRALSRGALVHFSANRFAEARAWCEQALAAHRDAGDARFEGTTLGQLGLIAAAQGDPRAAREHYGRALAVHERVGNAAAALLELVRVAVADLESGHHAAAADALRRALAACDGLGAAPYRPTVLAHAGVAHQLAGRHAEAREHLGRALAQARAVGDRQLERVVLAYAAAAHAAHGELDAADEALSRALAAGESADASHPERAALLWAHRAAVAAERGAIAQAETVLARARGLSRGRGEEVETAVQLHAVPVELARARAALAAGDVSGMALRRAARARVAAVRAALPEAGRGGLAVSLRVRLALGLAERALAADAPPPAAPAAVVARDAPRLTVHPEGEWFQLRDGPLVRCDTRRTLRRLLVCLVEQRLALPGRAVPSRALIQAGWPGERIVPAAARARLKVSLATLRRLGLRELLLTARDGYLLDPAVALELAPASADPVPTTADDRPASRTRE